MLGLSPARLQAYVKAGLLCPQRGHDGELRFSFQDLLLLRTAEGLVTERLPPRRVRDALQRLRRRLPVEQPLTGIQLGTEGGHVVVRDGTTAWRADSGQGLLTFSDPTASIRPEHAHEGTAIAELRPATSVAQSGEESGVEHPRIDGDGPQPTADDLYQLGCSLRGQRAGGRARRLPSGAGAGPPPRRHAREPGAADARVRGPLVRRGALPRGLGAAPGRRDRPFQPGVVLEDRGRPDAALEMYEATLAVDPANADAHFNAARLHDSAGHYEAALRHLREYRNLTGG